MLDPQGAHDVVINLQGDLPTIDPDTVRAVAAPLSDKTVDIATLAAEITREEERTDPNVTKAVIALPPGARQGKALYFTRATAPTGEGPLYHHIGIYGYTRAALARFVGLKPSPLERRERLEQLRALEAGMTIAVALVDKVPAGVDTQEDLNRARTELDN
jgi:3-deoxy-manno-octulosonate cytidylyltransferase (CMP-KDO synthetase)